MSSIPVSHATKTLLFSILKKRRLLILSYLRQYKADKETVTRYVRETEKYNIIWAEYFLERFNESGKTDIPTAPPTTPALPREIKRTV